MLRRKGSSAPVALLTSAGIQACSFQVLVDQANRSRIASSQNDDTIAQEKDDPQTDISIAGPDDLTNYDVILFGLAIPHGASTSKEWRAFWDRTGRQWFQKDYLHKVAGIFYSSSTPGSSLEQSMPTLVSPLIHHGIRYIPLGHKYSSCILEDMSEVHGGNAWGAGTFMVSGALRL